MSTTPFVTCDLLDANPNCQVYTAAHAGAFLKNFGGKQGFFGEIVTVKCFEDNSRVKELLGQNGKDDKGLGKILVVDGGGSLRCALLGDMIAQSALDNGWAGVVIYGCIRDVDEIAKMDLGVMALGAIPKKSVRRGEGQSHLDLDFGGMHLKSGMFLYADNNGVIVSEVPLF